MKPTAIPWQAIAVVACVLAVGVPYWTIPYHQLNLPSALPTVGLCLVALSALLVRACRLASSWRATWAIGGAVPLAVAIRVVVDVMRDATSHNLWPIEVVIAVGVGFACALTGALAGILVAAAVGVARRDA